jgi:hypothetical protein
MPKRASSDESIDPVRSRLAAQAAAPVTSVPDSSSVAVMNNAPKAEPRPAEAKPEGQGRAASAKPVKSRAHSLTVNRKVMVTPEEADQIEGTTRAISSAFGSRVSYSQVSRAMWTVLANASADESLRPSSRRTQRLAVPSKGDHVGMAEYEKALAEFLTSALKRS